jgi:hypothetical protein
MAIVVDVAEGDVDTEACRGTLVDTLNAVAAAASDAAGVPGFCGRQWADWETLSFAGVYCPVCPSAVHRPLPARKACDHEYPAAVDFASMDKVLQSHPITLSTVENSGRSVNRALFKSSFDSAMIPVSCDSSVVRMRCVYMAVECFSTYMTARMTTFLHLECNCL